jgi:hypothetical protein
MVFVKKLSKSFNPFIAITFILITACSNDYSDSSESKILEEINLVCEGDLFVDDHLTNSKKTQPDKRVYRFKKTNNGSYLEDFISGEGTEYYSMNIDDEWIRLTWESKKNERGYYSKSIKINRFSGDVVDIDLRNTDAYKYEEFNGSCITQDQKF